MRSSFNKKKPLKHEQTHDVLLFDLIQCHVDIDVYFCNKLFSEFLHSDTAVIVPVTSVLYTTQPLASP